MIEPLTVPPPDAHDGYAGFAAAPDLDGLAADLAILAIPYGDPYSIEEVVNEQTNMPRAVRKALRGLADAVERYDFDLGGTLFDGKPIRVVDCGDVLTDWRDLTTHYKRAEQVVRKILKAGAIPITIGGDHGIPIPVIRAFDGQGPVTLVQLDAHIDWRDHVNGAREGYSSPIRRASEMGHVGQIFQIGIRGFGSARPEEVAAAKAYGAQLITAWELHDVGMDAILARIPDGGRYYLTIDADGLDPGLVPAVMNPAPGGVTFHQARKLIHGLVAKGRVVGLDIVELAPKFDVNDISAITMGRLVINFIGAAVRAGYFDR